VPVLVSDYSFNSVAFCVQTSLYLCMFGVLTLPVFYVRRDWTVAAIDSYVHEQLLMLEKVLFPEIERCLLSVIVISQNVCRCLLCI